MSQNLPRRAFVGQIAFWPFMARRAMVNQTYTYNNLPCLLYTSPSPRDRTRSRMPSSA